MRFVSNRMAMVVAGSLVALLPHLVEAQVVPFHAEGEMAEYLPESGAYSGGGVGTHVGWHMSAGNAGPPNELVPTGNLGEFLWTTPEPHVITAADGSTISFEGGGLLQLIPLPGEAFSAVWSAEFVVQGGTGRFANVKPGDGPITVEAVNDPFYFDGSSRILVADVQNGGFLRHGLLRPMGF